MTLTWLYGESPSRQLLLRLSGDSAETFDRACGGDWSLKIAIIDHIERAGRQACQGKWQSEAPKPWEAEPPEGVMNWSRLHAMIADVVRRFLRDTVVVEWVPMARNAKGQLVDERGAVIE